MPKILTISIYACFQSFGIINTMNENTKKLVLLSVVLIGFVSIFFFDPYPQRLEYHNFADKRPIFGIQNSFDVLSNLPFSIFGIIGLIFWAKYPTEVARKSWFVAFLGIFLVGIGSAYYHYNPNNQTLIWDRLPLTIGFMGVLSALLSMCIAQSWEKFLLPGLVALGAVSVFYWAAYDDLRLYFYVQAIPLVVIPFVVFLFDSSKVEKSPLAFGLLFYLIAKVTEFSDVKIFEFTNQMISGHTIKHLLASLTVLALASLVKKMHLKRQPLF